MPTTVLDLGLVHHHAPSVEAIVAEVPHTRRMAQAKMTSKISQLKRELRSETKSEKGGSSGGGEGGSPIARSVSKRSSSRLSPGLGGGDDTESLVASLKSRVGTLESDLKRRQETYLKREQVDAEHISSLKKQLERATAERKSWMKEDKRVSLLKNMHSKIMKNIDHVQGTTARILQEQERDLLRAFRARLFDVQAELEKERSNKDDGSAALIEKNRQYEKDLDWAKEMADRLERVNQALGKENARLKSQFKTQQDDREFLIKELVTVRKDNERLRQECTRLRDNLQEKDEALRAAEKRGRTMPGMSDSTPILPPATGRGPGLQATGKTRPASAMNAGASKEKTKYKNIIQRMKVLLERERRNLQRARKSYEREVNQRTELEIFLRQCVQQVQNEIARRRNELIATDPVPPEEQMGGDRSNSKRRSPVGENGDELPLSEFSGADRERVMELLLSQERVVSLLYQRTFPVHGSSRNIDASGAVNPEIARLAGLKQ